MRAPGTSSRSCWPARRPSTDLRCWSACSARPASAIRRYADPAWRPDGLAQLDADAARAGCPRPSPAPITSSLTRRRSPRSRPRRRAWTCSPACWPARPRRRASRSTPSCAGSCCTGWSAAGPPAGRDRSRAGQGPDRRRRAVRASLPGRDPGGRGQGAAWAQIAERQPAQRHVPRRAARLHRRRTRTSCSRRTRQVLRRAGRHLAGRRAGHGQFFAEVALSGTADQPAGASTATAATSTSATRRPRCARLLVEGRDDVARALRCRSGTRRSRQRRADVS